MIGLSDRYSLVYFIHGERVGLRKKLESGDKIACLRPTAGLFFVQLLNGCGMCIFEALTSLLPVVEYLNAVTSWDLSADDYLIIGERILNIRKTFNVREGLVAADQRLNERAVGKPPFPKGPLKGISLDMENLQKEFFEIVGWDNSSGGPTQAKRKELGIEALFDSKA